MKFFIPILIACSIVGLSSAGLLGDLSSKTDLFDSIKPSGFKDRVADELSDLKNKLVDDLPNLISKFYVFTRKNLDQGQKVDYKKPETIAASNFNKAKDSVVLVHGYVESITNNPWVMEAKNLFLERGDVNVIVVDYNLLNLTTYQVLPLLVPKTMMVGKQLGKLIENSGSNPAKFYLVGNDIGAHVCGYAGKYLNGKVGRITGMDPTGVDWQIFHLPETQKLHYSQAVFVDTIHTDVNHTGAALGITKPMGHIDFYPNNGKYQPGCETERYQNIHKFAACSHQRAREFFMETLRSDNLPTPRGFLCKDYESFMAGQCVDCGASGDKCAILGLNASLYRDAYHPSNQVGRFFLNTGAVAPYFEYQYVANVELSQPKKGYIKVTFGNGQKVEIATDEKTTSYKKYFLSQNDLETVKDAKVSWMSGNGDTTSQKIKTIEMIPLSKGQTQIKGQPEMLTFCSSSDSGISSFQEINFSHC